MIQPGQTIPSVKVRLVNKGGITEIDTATALAQGRIVLFTVPGAFTPTCHSNHLPGYVELADQIKAAGIDRIVCGTVNDQFVTEAWAKQTNALGKVEFIADGTAAFAKALGLENDLSEGGLGLRFIRAAIVIDNGKIEAVYKENRRGVVTATGAPAILNSLRPA